MAQLLQFYRSPHPFRWRDEWFNPLYFIYMNMVWVLAMLVLPRTPDTLPLSLIALGLPVVIFRLVQRRYIAASIAVVMILIGSAWLGVLAVSEFSETTPPSNPAYTTTT